MAAPPVGSPDVRSTCAVEFSVLILTAEYRGNSSGKILRTAHSGTEFLLAFDLSTSCAVVDINCCAVNSGSLERRPWAAYRPQFFCA